MAHIDRRVRRTQTALAQALIALSLEKGYADVTIRDITARAAIGYATFFRHYADKQALLAAVLDVFVEELTALLETSPTSDATSKGTLLFRYVGDHHELCRVLLGSRSLTDLARQIRSSGASSALARQIAQPESPIPAEIVANHVASASIALIEWWFENNMLLSAERMGQIYTTLIVEPVQQLGFTL